MRGRFSFVVAGFIASVITLPITARAQEPRITLKSTAPFARVAEALERANALPMLQPAVSVPDTHQHATATRRPSSLPSDARQMIERKE